MSAEVIGGITARGFSHSWAADALCQPLSELGAPVHGRLRREEHGGFLGPSWTGFYLWPLQKLSILTDRGGRAFLLHKILLMTKAEGMEVMRLFYAAGKEVAAAEKNLAGFAAGVVRCGGQALRNK